MKRNIFVSLFVVLAVIFGVYVFWNKSQTGKFFPNTGVTPGTSTTTLDIPTSDFIQVTNPKPNDVIKSPAIVEGKARGTWYFEASFPAHVVDANNQVLGTSPIQAKGDWMTNDFVPFDGKISFESPTTATGFIVFQNDNPSGLIENFKEYRIPVRFETVLPVTTTVKVFFKNQLKLTKGQDDCTTVFSVERVVSSTAAIGRAAILELLKGVNASEKTNGYTTSLAGGVEIQNLTIENGVARVDFNSALDQSIGGSCRVAAIRAQITETLKQFPTVKTVIISRNSSVEDVLQP